MLREASSKNIAKSRLCEIIILFPIYFLIAAKKGEPHKKNKKYLYCFCNLQLVNNYYLLIDLNCFVQYYM